VGGKFGIGAAVFAHQHRDSLLRPGATVTTESSQNEDAEETQAHAVEYRIAMRCPDLNPTGTALRTLDTGLFEATQPSSGNV
jgi:hypothetical protein